MTSAYYYIDLSRQIYAFLSLSVPNHRATMTSVFVDFLRIHNEVTRSDPVLAAHPAKLFADLEVRFLGDFSRF